MILFNDHDDDDDDDETENFVQNTSAHCQVYIEIAIG